MKEVKKIRKQTILNNKRILTPLLLLSLTILLCAGAASAADGDVIYVNISGGNDDYDGFTPGTAKASIKNATGTVNTNGIVNIADGTYKGPGNRNITIDKNMIIIGQSQTGTVIDAEKQDRIFIINPGISLTLQKLTLQNGTAEHGGVIYNMGNLDVIGSTFTGNTANRGGAIYNWGNLDVSGSTFTGNTAGSYGGAIYNYVTLTVSGSTFTGNTANRDGGAIENWGNLTVIDSTFTGNTATGTPFGGGAIDNYRGTLTVTGSTFTGNTANRGGAIYNDDGTSTIHFSRIFGNTANQGSAIYCNFGSVNAEYNWWGSDSDPSGNVSGSVIVNPWLTNDPGSSLVFVDDVNGDDANDGSAPGTYAKKTIKAAVDHVAANGTIHIANGTYTGTNNRGITINKNMIIIGQSQTGTVIDAEKQDRIFIINPGISLTLQKLTLQNGTANHGGAIYNMGNLDVIGSIFTGNTATNAGGGAIYNYASLTVIDSTFTGNTAGSYGGAIYNYGTLTLTVSGSTFINNTATVFGGAIENYGTLTVTDSTFTGNTAAWGGAIYNYGGTSAIHFSRIFGNTANQGSAIYCYSGSVNAEYNWWGFNTDPKTILNLIAGQINSVDADPWLVLTVTADPTNIPFDGNSTITTDLLHDSDGVYHDPVNGHVPDGIPVTFTATNGTINPASTTLSAGNATSTFTAVNPGTGNITVTIDNQTVSTQITINKIPTNTTVTSVSGYAGQNVTLTANVTAVNGVTVNEGTVQFTVNNVIVDTAPVNNGTATLNWTIPVDWSVGLYSILAEFLGTDNFTASSGNGTLTVNKTPTQLTVTKATGVNNATVHLTATLTDIHNNPLANKTVTFNVNGAVIGTATTNSDGTATLTYKITQNTGNYNISAIFAGDAGYLDSEGAGILTVDPSAGLYLKITASKANLTVGETFIITYKLGNYGPDAAENITITFQVPEGLEFVSINVDNGKWNYDPSTRTVTWTLDNVPVGDPYLYLTVKALNSGTITITPTITSDTYNWNSEDNTININIQPSSNGGSDDPENTANAATILMQKTGTPINYLIIAILMVIAGLVVPKRK